MPAPWVAGAQARIVGLVHGQQCINTWDFATNTQINDPPQLDVLLLQLAEALLDCALTTLLPGVTSDYTLVQCDAKRIYPVLSDPIVATAPAGSVGELGPTSVSFAATLVNLRTGQNGRRGRGKKFFPPPGEANIATSAIDQPTLVQIAAFLTCVAGKFLGANPTTDWRLGILSRTTLKEVGGSFDNSFQIVSSMNPSQFTARMGSRKVGKGA